MHDAAGRWPQVLTSRAIETEEGTALAGEFEARLADSSNLAFRVAYSVLRHRQDAEDVAQEAFVRAHREFHRLRDRDRFRGWLARMAWRLALDHRRGQKRRTAREDRAARPDMTPSHEGAAIDAQRSARLWAAIDALPERLRVVIVLASIEGHGLKEVAQIVEAPEGTVKSRLFEARQKLQEMLR
jgi:RNA polymerase sigma-70 factor (ECF subfamily)